MVPRIVEDNVFQLHLFAEQMINCGDFTTPSCLSPKLLYSLQPIYLYDYIDRAMWIENYNQYIYRYI